MNAHPDGVNIAVTSETLNTVSVSIDTLTHTSRRRRHRRNTHRGCGAGRSHRSLLCSPIKIREAVRLAAHTLQACDFIVEPQIAVA